MVQITAFVAFTAYLIDAFLAPVNFVVLKQKEQKQTNRNPVDRDLKQM